MAGEKRTLKTLLRFSSGWAKTQEAREIKAGGHESVLTRWLLLKRPENLTEKQEVRLSDLLRYRLLRSVGSYLLKDDVQHLSYCAVILFLGIFPVGGASAQSEASDTKAPSKALDFTEVERQAKALAGRPHIPVTQTLPEFLDRLDYDQYRDIRYRRETVALAR